MGGNLAVVKLLLEKGADVNTCDKVFSGLHVSSYLPLNLLQNGFSPVYVASLKGYKDIVDVLVNEGANIHIATFEVLVY